MISGEKVAISSIGLPVMLVNVPYYKERGREGIGRRNRREERKRKKSSLEQSEEKFTRS